MNLPLERPGFDHGRRGLYDPKNEHDACGVGFVVDIKNRKSHDIVASGLKVLTNLTHRGAVGADPDMGDGAGILIQIPDALFQEEMRKQNCLLPNVGRYGVGMLFMPQERAVRLAIEVIIADVIDVEGQKLLGWRDAPVASEILGASVRKTEPVMRQVFIGAHDSLSDDEFERKLFVIRKQISNRATKLFGPRADDFYVASMSSRTIVYKGMLLANLVGPYFKDLTDPRLTSAIAMVHQRFSTNTFPRWNLAHPFRMISHNGEINTMRGNLNWMNARRHSMRSSVLGDDIHKIWPLTYEGQSDSASFDNALELLVSGGYSLAHAMMMMIPEAWAGNALMDEDRRAFYEYHAALMEPWDGPAAVCFTDGRQIGAMLDRNGLRPARYYLTDDGRAVMASEMGVLPIDDKKIVKKWRLEPGKMLLIDLEQGRIIDDSEIKSELSHARPYAKYLAGSQFHLEKLAKAGDPPISDLPLLARQKMFGYSREDLKILLPPLAVLGQEAIGSMGTDTPISVLSSKSKLLFSYFQQCFAQVTNPPIDSIREETVMSLTALIGPRLNLLGGSDAKKRLEATQPILSNDDMQKIRDIGRVTYGAFQSMVVDIVWPRSEGADGLEKALLSISLKAIRAIDQGADILILSDRAAGPDLIPIPSLLAVSAVHQYLIREGRRCEIGLVIETGEAREIHHFCALAGFGAEMINPWLAFETLDEIRPTFAEPISFDDAVAHFIKGADKGMLKVMAKMGISTWQSYCGAQIFDAVGLEQSFLDSYFTGALSAVGGAGIREIAEETAARHKEAFAEEPLATPGLLDVGGEYAQRKGGEEHSWNFGTISSLQHAVRANSRETFSEFSRQINDQDRRLMTLRGLFEIRPAGEEVPLSEVEPASEIVKRFATGAMSYGSISLEAHTNLAIAMNRIGGKSNTGEGGEEVERFKTMPNGDSKRSAIKQVASGRFGVTAEYLVNADDIQIKMAQGAKPGEGGQLPGDKVDAAIAAVRHSTKGVGLISPPPHHDIYSIEDLAQLIFDLKNVNRQARISVKLVSELGVGTVAAGVAKARADHVTISGYDGGTGASPLTSIKHAGSPWEIGLAETQQTLVMNQLRGRIVVQVDGGLRTGRDVIVGALLGADEFGFATAPLIASGCVMMRKCHLNTCPVGVATQDPILRKRFKGQPEHVINYFFFVAEEVREIMAKMGVRSLSELTGRSDLLDKRQAIEHWKAKGLDFGRLFFKPDDHAAIRAVERQQHPLDNVLDLDLIALSHQALESKTPVRIEKDIHNTDRTVGAMLSGEIAKIHGNDGLPDKTIQIRLTGVAGQSFGAFLAHGVELELIGEANDYVGKGLSGGRIIVRPPEDSTRDAENNVIAGNTVLYGATGGEAWFRGVAGERFAVRNSGAVVTVEGVGDHGCEYMTGGVVAVLGETGRNFAAGMSGGIAYVFDETGNFPQRCNKAMVELGRIPPDSEALADKASINQPLNMLRFDETRLKGMIEAHWRYTGSAKAKALLDDWRASLAKFVKVTPIDYRLALKTLAAEQVEHTVAKEI